MRTGRGDRPVIDRAGCLGIDHRHQRRFAHVDKESVALSVVNRPPGAARKQRHGYGFSARRVHDRERVAGYIRYQDAVAPRIPRQTIRSTADGDPRPQPWADWVDEMNLSYSARGGNYQIGGRRTDDPAGLWAIRDGGEVAQSLAVDDLERAIGGMGNEYTSARLVHIPVVEAPWSGVGRKLEVRQQVKRH